jgi:hypothetical protein
MNYQCRHCGEDHYVLVCPVFWLSLGWYLSWALPFLHYGVHQHRSGFLARGTRHGCGREWVVSPRGLAEPGVSTPARIAASPRLPKSENEGPEPNDPLRGAIRRAEV